MYFLEKCEKLFFTKTPQYVIIHDSDSLQIGIDDSRTNETHSAFFEIFADCIGKLCFCWNFAQVFWIIFHLFISYKIPKICRKTSKFLLNFKKYFCVFSHGKNFESVSDNSFVLQNIFEFLIAEF